VLSLAAPEADAGRLTALLSEKLASLALPEPVRLCELRSGPLVSRATPSISLWQPGEHGGGAGAESPAFLERLRTRLGADAIYGLEILPEHRPEAALARCESTLLQPEARSPKPEATFPPIL
jgi:protein ImuB